MALVEGLESQSRSLHACLGRAWQVGTKGGNDQEDIPGSTCMQKKMDVVGTFLCVHLKVHIL